MRKIALFVQVLLFSSVVLAQYPDPLVNASKDKLRDDLPRLVRYVEEDPSQVVLRGDLLVTVTQLKSLFEKEKGETIEIKDISNKVTALERSLSRLGSPPPKEVNIEIEGVLKQLEIRLPTLIAGTSTIQNLDQRVASLESGQGYTEGQPQPVNKNVERMLVLQVKEIRKLQDKLQAYININSPKESSEDGSRMQIMLFLLVMIYGFMITF